LKFIKRRKELSCLLSDFLRRRRKRSVLIHLCCCNKIPQTGKCINIRNLFLTILEAGKPKVKVPAVLVSGEGCSLLPKWLLRFKYKMCPHKFMY
jgi:hypothetical protein